MSTEPMPVVALAVRHLLEGHRTLYVTTHFERMRSTLELIVAALPAEATDCVRRGCGNEEIRCTSGGVLQFRASAMAGRGFSADVLLLDEVSDQVEQEALPCLAGSSVAEVNRW